jgi:hypothetical protein
MRKIFLASAVLPAIGLGVLLTTDRTEKKAAASSVTIAASRPAPKAPAETFVPSGGRMHAGAPPAPARPPSNPRDLLARLATATPETAGDLYDELKANPDLLADPSFVSSLLAIVSDPKTRSDARALALSFAGRASAADGNVVDAIKAFAVSTSLDPETRNQAVAALQQMALDRSDLEPRARAALLDAAAFAASGEARAIALSGVRTENASPDEVARTGDFLGDADPYVRSAAARSLAQAPAAVRGSVAGQLVSALARETDTDAAATLVDAALEVARGDAPTVLAQMASAPIAQSSADVARRISDYREALASGELDTARIRHSHEVREDARAK